MLHPQLQTGVVYPQIELRGDPDAVRRIGTAAEDLGFDHLLAYDHVLGAQHADRDPELTGPYDEHDPFHDPLVLFAYLAGRTERPLGPCRFVLERQFILVHLTIAMLLVGIAARLGVGTVAFGGGISAGHGTVLVWLGLKEQRVSPRV